MSDPNFEGHERFWPPSPGVSAATRERRLSWHWWCMSGRNLRVWRERAGWRGYARTLEERNGET